MRYEYRHGGNVHAEPGGERFLDFSASINPLGPPKQVEPAIQAALGRIDRYPDSRSSELRSAIAAFERVPPEWVFCAAGSSDILFRLPRAAGIRRGLVLKPSFSDYRRALAAAGADVAFHALSEQNGFACDESLLQTLETRPAELLILCNPNNPTGRLTQRPLVERILEICRNNNALVLVDECFLDLTGDAAQKTSKKFLPDFENLVVLKAFTKTFALPGLRLGYAICSDTKLLDRFAFAGPDWPVSNLAQAAGIAALRDADRYLAESLAMIEKERRYVKDELEELGYTVYGAGANFLFARNPYRFDLREHLDRKFVRIRSFAAEDGLDASFFRIGLQSHENNTRLIEALRSVTKEAGGKT